MVADITSVLPKDQILTPKDGEAYKEALHRWADNAERPAKFIVFPKTSEEVANTVKWAVANGLEIAIKGGGHSTSGASSSEDLVIDLRHFGGVTVDTEKRLLTVGGGAIWETVDKEAAKYGLATVGGTVNHTGVGGLTLGGGYGWLTPKYGLTIDNLVQAEVVTASGDILTCSETENADLFWAIRGAGSNFGVVTYFVLKAYPQTNPVWSGLVVFTPPQLPALIKAARTWAASASEDESCFIFFACPPPAFQPMPVLLPFFNGPEEDARKRFKPFFDVGPVADMTKVIPYEQQNSLQNPMAGHGDRKVLKSAALSAIDEGIIMTLFKEYVKLTQEQPEAKTCAILVELHSFEKLMQVPFEATSFANRGPFYNITFALRWKSPELDSVMREWASSHAKAVRHEESERSGMNLEAARGYANFGLGDEKARDVFGENYDRLAEVKAKYDPQLVFRKWFPIVPKGYTGEVPA
ncbi:FAD-binding oxidoreductase [Phanerochaete sordida]|uniref:FAD-binding oxidoreductase n=1 Tax=Phanerochaete sordida TaxID=48140 RepID=A0A9P3LMZ4_9APHY|nr:FAD-binding oxidoreductase [Phanerochaete sordida]